MFHSEKMSSINIFQTKGLEGLAISSRFSKSREGGALGFMLAGYVPLASQSPYPIKVYFVANYRPHLSHFLEYVIFAIPT